MMLQLFLISMWLLSSTGHEDVVVPFNDHIDCEIDRLSLQPEHYSLIMTAFNSPRVQNDQFKYDASLTHWNVTPHQFYRYLASGGFTGKYNGKAILDAAVDTV